MRQFKASLTARSCKLRVDYIDVVAIVYRQDTPRRASNDAEAARLQGCLTVFCLRAVFTLAGNSLFVRFQEDRHEGKFPLQFLKDNSITEDALTKNLKAEKLNKSSNMESLVS